MKKNLLCLILLFASLFASVSVASATEIALDTGHHHLGDNFKEELTPGDPEGLVFTSTFTLDPSVNIESAELALTGKSIVPGPTDEFLDKVYLNEIEIGALNDYIPAETPDSTAVNIKIPVHPSLFDSGSNTIKISAGSNANLSNYDDFEFYNLSLHVSKIEPVTLAPPLEVAWTYKFPWRLVHGIPEFEILIADGVLYICQGYSETSVTAIDTETGELLWDKKLTEQGNLEYKDGVLFVVNYSTIDALNAKTGELLWSRGYQGGWPGISLISGNTLFVSAPDNRYVTAIDTESGALKWVYEINTQGSGNGNIDSCYISGLQTNGNILAFRYDIPHDHGLIALDPETGKEVWRYTNLREYSHDPFFYKDLVYVGGEEIIALSAESGEEVWKTDTDEWVISTEIESDKLLVKEELSNNSYRSVVLDVNTGEILEELPCSELYVSSSTVTDEYAYSTGGCKIKVFDSGTGEPVWSSSRIKGAAVSEPVLYKDKLYLVSSDGVLYAFEHGEGGLFFTKGLEDSAILYLPPVATAGMLLLLTVLLRKNENKTLVLGSWLIALVGVLLLSFIAIQPYFIAWDIFGMLTFLVLCSLAVILLFGIAFLVSGLRKRRK